MERDPRVDPQPGDMFVRYCPTKAYRRTVIRADPVRVKYYNGANLKQWAWRGSWDAWVKSAIVTSHPTPETDGLP